VSQAARDVLAKSRNFILKQRTWELAETGQGTGVKALDATIFPSLMEAMDLD